MKNKRTVLIILLSTMVIGFLLLHDGKTRRNAEPAAGSGNFSQKVPQYNTNTRNAAGSSRIEQRLAQLKQMQELPQDASIADRRLVEQTSWWGKPIDPKTFWKGKTVWLDMKAKRAALKVGRLYPPIPFGETKFSSSSEKDIAGSTAGSEAGSTSYHFRPYGLTK